MHARLVSRLHRVVAAPRRLLSSAASVTKRVAIVYGSFDQELSMEDAAAVEVVQSVLQLQVYLLSLWEKGFATAAEPDENDAREAEGLRYELQQQEYADGTRLGPRASQHARSPAALSPFPLLLPLQVRALAGVAAAPHVLQPAARPPPSRALASDELSLVESVSPGLRDEGSRWSVPEWCWGRAGWI